VQGTLAHVPQDVVVSQVGQRGNVLGQAVGQLVQRADDEASLATAETLQVAAQFVVELVVELAQPRYAPVAALAWLVGDLFVIKR